MKGLIRIVFKYPVQSDMSSINDEYMDLQSEII